MAFTVSDLQDMLGLVREHPQIQAQFQMLVVPPELLALANRFAELTGVVTQLAEAQQRTEQRLEQLAEAQQRTEQRLEQLAEAQHETERRLQQLEVTVGRLSEDVRALVNWQRGEAGRRDGERYERLIAKRAPALFHDGQGGVTDELFVQQRISKLLLPLTAEGLFGDDEDPFLADLIWWKGDQFAVVEVSRQVNGHDVDRAARRADTLRRAGLQAIAVVIGEEWTDPLIRQRAEELGVQWKVGRDLSPGLLQFRQRSAQ